MPMSTFVLPTGLIKKRKPGRQSPKFKSPLWYLAVVESYFISDDIWPGRKFRHLLKVPHSSLCCLISSAAALDEFPALDSCFFYAAGPSWCCPPPYSLPVETCFVFSISSVILSGITASGPEQPPHRLPKLYYGLQQHRW